MLDNVEHLPSIPRFVSDLLHGAPGVRLLATSRANLGLAAEWRCDGAGLSHRSNEASDVERLEVGVDPPEPDHGAPSSEAAAWTRVLDVDAIDQSWSMLQPREQVGMRRLSVFRGGFDLAAAREVARLALPVVLALVNESIVWRGADGRFALHPLVWRDARGRALAHDDEVEEARSRHARCFLRMLAERQHACHHRDAVRMMREVRVDPGNVILAWRWTARARRLRGATITGGVRLAEGRADTTDWAWVNVGIGLALIST